MLHALRHPSSASRYSGETSETDELTGIPSRRFVMARLEELCRQEGACDHTVGCLAILDIDNFKYINDRFGHLIGDTVLKNFAATLQKLARKTDILGRAGGEEFLLVLPKTVPEMLKRMFKGC